MANRKKATTKKKASKKTASKKVPPKSVKSKKCARCLDRKPLDSFGKNSRMKLGRKSYCRDCSRELQREWNKEQRVATKSKKAPARKSKSKAKRR